MTLQDQPLLSIEPVLKDYAWGDTVFIPGVLGRPATGEPVAEAWYGAHAQGPSPVSGAPGLTLDALIAGGCEHWLGGEASARYGELPFLVKLLAAARPLSIQVHPDPAQARAGFEREEAAGIPRDAPHRCYGDPRAKPELMLALEPFEALCGFRSPEEIRDALARQTELAPLSSAFRPGWSGYRDLLELWFAMPDTEVRDRQSAMLERLASAAQCTEAERLLLEIAAQWPGDLAGDRGLLFALLLERVCLAPGEAMFLKAGVPHAYLRGAGLEVMASSDNVLRAGLTPKRVAAQELLRIVRFAEGGWSRVAASPVDAVSRRWQTAASEFELSMIELAGADAACVEWLTTGPEIMILLRSEGDAVRVGAADLELALSSGGACFIGAGVDVRLSGAGAVARVAVPRIATAG